MHTRHLPALACLLFAFAAAVAPAHAQDVAVSGGVNVRVASGTFGGQTTSTIVYAPATLHLDVGRFEVAGYFPYIAIRDRTGTLSDAGWIPMQGAVSGAPTVGMSPAAGMGSMMAGGMMGQSNGRTTAPGSPQTVPYTTSGPASLGNSAGFGDVAGSVGYRVVDDVLTGVQLVVSTRVKAPTASIGQGLGTGRADVGAAATVRKALASGWLYADLGYVVVGKPAGTDLRNAVTWGAGGGMRIASSRVFFLAMAFGNTSVLSGYAAPVEIGAGVGIHLADRLNLTAIPSAGLTDASPRYGVMLGLSTDLKRR